MLRGKVERDLEKRYSAEQIAGRLRVQFPDDPELWVSHETILQSLYVQSRGALRRELTAFLRTGMPARTSARHRPSQAPLRSYSSNQFTHMLQPPPESAVRLSGRLDGALRSGSADGCQ